MRRGIQGGHASLTSKGSRAESADKIPLSDTQFYPRVVVGIDADIVGKTYTLQLMLGLSLCVCGGGGGRSLINLFVGLGRRGWGRGAGRRRDIGNTSSFIHTEMLSLFWAWFGFFHRY